MTSMQAASAGEMPTEEIETAIAEIAGGEYDGTDAGRPGYHEAWGQAAACITLFQQFGLSDIYR